MVREFKLGKEIIAATRSYVQVALRDALRKQEMLEPDGLSMQEGLPKRKHYDWTEEKRAYLIQLLEEHPDFGYQEIADAINEKFPDGVKVDRYKINAKLSFDIYKEKPELRRIAEYRPSCEWTKEKRSYLVKLLVDFPELSHEELADKLNEKFPNGVQAEKDTVKGIISRIHQENKELRCDSLIFEEPRELDNQILTRNYASIPEDILGLSFGESSLPSDPEKHLLHLEKLAWLKVALENLSARERYILEKRFGLGCEEQTLESVAHEIGISRERTRQIEIKALSKLRRSL
ncbi:MAG: sigma factor-like helix-turn-helix DNA-binding protein [Candidatus Micrarchaeota archaeon]